MTGIIRITLQSDLCAGSGEASGATVDRDLCVRDSGLPCVPARRLKGCLLDAAQLLQRYGAADGDVIAAVFGTNTGITGAIRVQDALLPGTEAMEAWLSAAPKPLAWAARPLNVERLFTTVRGQTRLEGGVAADGSLRYTRVLGRCNAMDGDRETVLEAPVALSPGRDCAVTEEQMSDLLALCARATRHMGTSRNRGLGYVRVEWIPDSALLENRESRKGSGRPEERETMERRDCVNISDSSRIVHIERHTPNNSRAGRRLPDSPRVEIRYTLSLDAPVSLNGSQENSAEIPARAVIGCVSAAYLRTGQADAPLFRDLFLSGNPACGAQWSALTPVIGGRRSVPAPLSLVKMKNDDTCRNLLTQPVRPDEKKGQLAGYYAVPTEEGFLLSRPVSHTKYHHSHGETGTLYMQDSLDAGMLYAGTVTVPTQLAEPVLALLEETDFAFGRSRSAQYALCSLCGDIEVVPVEELNAFPVGGTLYAVLESDLVLTRKGIYTADCAAVREAVAEALGIEEESGTTLRDYCDFHTISGFQERWRLQKPQIPAAAAGSVYGFHVKGTTIRCFQTRDVVPGEIPEAVSGTGSEGRAETVSRFISLGDFQKEGKERRYTAEFRQEGFGKIRLYTAEEMARRTLFATRKVDTISQSGNAPEAVERLEAALTAAAGVDALRKSMRDYYAALRKVYREQKREKGTWIQTGTLGRLRLMLEEAAGYEDFLLRMSAIRESDVHSQKTRSERVKALELVRGICEGGNMRDEKLSVIAGAEVKAERLLSRCGDADLLRMILHSASARKAVEEHWRDALRYLLYIAYYDRKAG